VSEITTNTGKTDLECVELKPGNEEKKQIKSIFPSYGIPELGILMRTCIRVTKRRISTPAYIPKYIQTRIDDIPKIVFFSPYSSLASVRMSEPKL